MQWTLITNATLKEKEMTEERKEELRQLLEKAMENLEIRPYGGFDGVCLIPLSNSTGDLPRCWGGLPNPNQNFFRRTLLAIEYSVFPIFHNPFLLATTEDKER